jgi:hypothetical protein
MFSENDFLRVHQFLNMYFFHLTSRPIGPFADSPLLAFGSDGVPIGLAAFLRCIDLIG